LKSNEYEGSFKCQFTDVSYHHKKSDLSWQIQYYLPSDLENPILSLRSPSFKVFARKPSTKKRKISIFDHFVSRLDDLVKASKKLKSNEKKLAFDLVTSKLLKLDPDYYTSSIKKNTKN